MFKWERKTRRISWFYIASCRSTPSTDAASGSSFRFGSREQPIARHYPRFPRHFSVTRAISFLSQPNPLMSSPRTCFFSLSISTSIVCFRSIATSLFFRALAVYTLLAVCSLFASFGPRKYHLPSVCRR